MATQRSVGNAEKREWFMKPAPFEYQAPETIADAVGLLRQYGDEAKVLAGGQSLVPMLAMRLTRFPHLIDINRLSELDGIEVHDQMVAIGAGTRQSTLERNPILPEVAPLLGKAVRLIGHF